MAKVTKDMIIADVLQMDEGVGQILLNAGLNCVYCPSASGETLEGAGLGHGIDIDALIEEINALLDAK